MLRICIAGLAQREWGALDLRKQFGYNFFTGNIIDCYGSRLCYLYVNAFAKYSLAMVQ